MRWSFALVPLVAVPLVGCDDAATNPHEEGSFEAEAAFSPNAAQVIATGDALIQGGWGPELKVDLTVIEQRRDVRGTVEYINLGDENTFFGDVRCYAELEDSEYGDELLVSATAADDESDWDHLVFYIQDNASGGSGEERDQFRALELDDPDCTTGASESNLHPVVEGNLRIH